MEPGIATGAETRVKKTGLPLVIDWKAHVRQPQDRHAFHPQRDVVRAADAGSLVGRHVLRADFPHAVARITGREIALRVQRMILIHTVTCRAVPLPREESIW